MPEPETGGLYLLRKESASDRLPSILTPVLQRPNTALTTDPILALDPRGLSDFGLRLTLGESISTPNTLFSSPAAYACLAMGFPQLEFSANEVIAWPRPPAVAAAQQRPRQPDVRGPSARHGGKKCCAKVGNKTVEKVVEHVPSRLSFLINLKR